MTNLYLPYKVKILDINRETSDVRTYRLRRSETEIMPRFAAGKFVMAGLPGVGEAPISLSAFNKNGGFSLTIRAVGRVTNHLTRMRAGDEIYCRGPYGRGWPLETAKADNLLLVAGGLGLAPLRPIIAAVQKKELFDNVHLIYGSRDPDNLLFTNEYELWRNFMDVSLTVDEVPAGVTWEHDVGLVTGVIDRLRPDPANTLAFVCGPEIMMRFVSRQLLRLGLPANRVLVSMERRMRCGFGHCGHCQHGPTFVCRDGPVFNYDEVNSFPDTLL